MIHIRVSVVLRSEGQIQLPLDESDPCLLGARLHVHPNVHNKAKIKKLVVEKSNAAAAEKKNKNRIEIIDYSHK